MDSDLFNRIASNIVRIDVKSQGVWGNGSGILMDQMGTILTCEHVIFPNGLQPEDIRVVRKSELPKHAEILNFDENRDVALIRVDDLSGDYKVSSCPYEEVNIGDKCAALGYPVGLPHLTLTGGTISAKGKALISQFPFELIQIDARVNHGNSGGPVFLDTGELIGIVTMKYIPFFDKINELHNYVNSLPQYSGHRLIIPYIEISLTEFIDTVYEAIRRMTTALDMVQVGIGWVVPIQYFTDLLNSSKL